MRICINILYLYYKHFLSFFSFFFVLINEQSNPSHEAKAEYVPAEIIIRTFRTAINNRWVARKSARNGIKIFDFSPQFDLFSLTLAFL